MKYLIISIELIFLLLAGFILKWVSGERVDNDTVKSLIINFFLPVLLFVSFSQIHQKEMHALSFFCFGLIVCVFYTLFFYALFSYKFPYDKGQKLILLTTLSSVAPGLTIFPFADSYLGRGSLAVLSVMNLGVKIYLLTYVYFSLNKMMLSKAQTECQHLGYRKTSVLAMAQSACYSFLKEPIIIAIIIGLIFYFTQTSIFILSPTAGHFFNIIGNSCTLLIMLFIGISLFAQYNMNNTLIDFSLLILRSGIGLIISALYCYFLHIDGKKMLLYVAFTQGAVSLVPFVFFEMLAAKFDHTAKIDRVMSCITLSFLLTIIFMLALFNMSSYFTQANTSWLQICSALSGVVMSALGLILYFTKNSIA